MGTRRDRRGASATPSGRSRRDDPSPPAPSFADLGYLALLSARLRRDRAAPALAGGTLRGGLWLDGVISGFADRRGRHRDHLPGVLDTLGGSRAAVATNIAYPLADLTLIGARRLGARRHRLAARPHVGAARRRAARLLGQRLPLPLPDAAGTYVDGSADRPRLGRPAACCSPGPPGSRATARPSTRDRGLAAARRAGRLRPRSASACSLYDHFDRVHPLRSCSPACRSSASSRGWR